MITDAPADHTSFNCKIYLFIYTMITDAPAYHRSFNCKIFFINTFFYQYNDNKCLRKSHILSL